MRNIITIILKTLIFITGIFWSIHYIKKEKKYSDSSDVYVEKKKYMSKNTIKKIGSFFPILMIILFFRTCLYEPFNVPSNSMYPTLIPGDHIIVKKFAYNILNPITNNILFHTNDPLRNDVIVFEHPYTHDYHVKRIIGIPGDLLTYNPYTKKILISNFDACKKKYKKNVLKKIHKKNKKKITYNTKYSVHYIENFYKKKHEILLYHNKKIHLPRFVKQDFKKKWTWKIPKDCYFVMGDNRDKSWDSRFWGFLPKKNIIGKAEKILFNFNIYEKKISKIIKFWRFFNSII